MFSHLFSHSLKVRFALLTLLLSLSSLYGCSSNTEQRRSSVSSESNSGSNLTPDPTAANTSSTRTLEDQLGEALVRRNGDLVRTLLRRSADPNKSIAPPSSIVPGGPNATPTPNNLDEAQFVTPLMIAISTQDNNLIHLVYCQPSPTPRNRHRFHGWSAEDMATAYQVQLQNISCQFSDL